MESTVLGGTFGETTDQSRRLDRLAQQHYACHTPSADRSPAMGWEECPKGWQFNLALGQ